MRMVGGNNPEDIIYDSSVAALDPPLPVESPRAKPGNTAARTAAGEDKLVGLALPKESMAEIKHELLR